jgi:hypothetical protein
MHRYIPYIPVSKRTAMILMLTVLSLALASCSSEDSHSPAAPRQFRPVLRATTAPLTPVATPDISATISAAFAAAQPLKSQASVIPDDVTYSVIHSKVVSGIRKSIDVRLNKKVSEATLRAIALELKSGDSRPYDRTFIVYYLPEMPVGAGGWATTHFDPGLNVRILGLTPEKANEGVGSLLPSTREDIGRWSDDRNGTQIVIYLDRGKPYVEQFFNDGSVLKEELVESLSPLGRRFESKGGSSLGDHWVIEPSGKLQTRDNVGLVYTANPIN